MKNVLKAILILAIMFNCATFGNYSVYADCSHVFGEYVITQKSGCTTTGSKYRVCKKCGYKSTVMINLRSYCQSVPQKAIPLLTAQYQAVIIL